MNPYGTHIPILLACLHRTSGPILELGSGWYSTPLINAFAHGRLARTIESDPDWFAKISAIGLYHPHTTKSHQFIFAPDFDLAPVKDQRWSVALIDHEPPSRRGGDLERLRDHSDLIIAHDTEHDAYNYRPVLDSFQYQTTFRQWMPWTTVVSDTVPLDWLDELVAKLG